MEKDLSDELDVMRYIQETFPQSEWVIQYMWNPFNLVYTSFGLIKRDQKTWNPFNDSDGMAKTLRETISVKFPNFKFEEEWNGKEYDQEFLLQFLISLGYEYPADKKLRELMNPFSGEKIIIHYDENDEPYLIVDGERQYRKGR